MADNKRNSIAGKAATPKPAANANANSNSTSNDSDGSLSKAIGARYAYPQVRATGLRLTTFYSIRITYNGQRTVEGTLYTADTQTNLVAVNTSTSTADTNPLLPGDFVIIPISSIESFQLLSLASTATTDGPASAPAPPAVPTLSKADYAALKAREETAIKEMKERDASRGKGVSKEGQEIFDHFKRTYVPETFPQSVPLPYLTHLLTHLLVSQPAGTTPQS